MMTLEDHMTQDMKDNLIGEDYLKKEIRYCLENLISARRAAEISLPATSASGLPVTHGCRMYMWALVNYWGTRIDGAKKLLSGAESDQFLQYLGIPVRSSGNFRDYGVKEKQEK